jgi:chromosome partitioning protein
MDSSFVARRLAVIVRPSLCRFGDGRRRRKAFRAAHQGSHNSMIVVTVASRKGGSGKSTLTAHLAAYGNKSSRRCLLVDADPQGSLTLWHSLRKGGEPMLLRTATRGVDNLISAAGNAGLDWVFIDTPPNMSAIVNDAIRAATLVVIPARPSVFDIDAVKDTIAYARERRKPYAVVLNAVPPRRDNNEAMVATVAREALDKLKAPVWSGQITQRGTYSLAVAEGEGAREFDPESGAASEIARLFSAIEKSVRVIKGDATAAHPMHRRAA